MTLQVIRLMGEYSIMYRLARNIIHW